MAERGEAPADAAGGCGGGGSGGGGGGGPALSPFPSPSSSSSSSSPRCALASCLAELVGRFKRCSRCRLAHYCSGEHQALDWPSHRAFCNAEHARAEAAAPAPGAVPKDLRVETGRAWAAWRGGEG